ncbi:hypothetical protein DVS77_00715 [Mycolicibacterium moriokaense]|nr:hypothetical protein DVS77_00715 [Mycolicibacterium moriokaense]
MCGESAVTLCDPGVIRVAKSVSCLMSAGEDAADLLLSQDLGGAAERSKGHEVLGVLGKDVLIGKRQFCSEALHSSDKLAEVVCGPVCLRRCSQTVRRQYPCRHEESAVPSVEPFKDADSGRP